MTNRPPMLTRDLLTTFRWVRESGREGVSGGSRRRGGRAVKMESGGGGRGRRSWPGRGWQGRRVGVKEEGRGKGQVGGVKEGSRSREGGEDREGRDEAKE